MDNRANPPLDPYPGQAVYTPAVLAIYDTMVLRICGPLGWGCPLGRIRRLYDRYVSENHLEIGVGTGYFLKRCRRLRPGHQVTLLDMNENSLRWSARRLAALSPVTVRANVLEPIDLPPASFGSIGMNQLLHCLPGAMADKSPALGNAARLMRPGAVLFGTTVLWRGQRHNWLGRRVTHSYNARGIWSTYEDDLEGLRAILAEHFDDFDVEMYGRAAAFMARKA